MPVLRLYSKLYMEVEDDSWSARPNISAMHELPRDQETGRWIVHIRHGDSQVHIALGDPVANTAQNPSGLYLPPWALNALSLEGAGEEVQVQFLRCEEFEKATSLTFQLLGGRVDDAMIRDILEEYLSQVGVLEEGQMIPLPMMDGLVLLVSQCEPSVGTVFLDGNEVALHIEQSRPSSPLLAAQQEQPQQQDQQTQQDQQIQQIQQIQQDQTGQSIPMVPPSTRTSFTRRRQNHQPSSFVAFSGVGRTLRDS